MCRVCNKDNDDSRYVTSLARPQTTSYHISLFLIAVASNVAALTALAAHGRIGALASNVTSLAAVTAGALVLALAGNVAGLTAVAAHGLVGAVASDVAHLVAVVAHHVSAHSGSASLTTTPSAHKHTPTPQGTRRPCGRADRTCSTRPHASGCCWGNREPCGPHHRSCSTSSGSPLPQRALPPHPFPPPLTVGAIASLVASLVANVALHLRRHFRQQASYLLLCMNKL